MRWVRSKLNNPRQGDMRTLTIFAWLPVDCGRECRWFEKVVILQHYSIHGDWVNAKFLN